jgi:photosynthetic reaction center cytochrome c subunit
VNRAGPALAVVALGLAACESPSNVTTVQQGYRGTGMVAVQHAARVAAVAEASVVPDPLPPVPGGGPLAKDIYENVQVLTDLDVAQFTRIMAAMTNWVAPEQGCVYCHADDGGNASDAKYQKVVSRRMLEMVRHLNGSWTAHVGQTGVTCFTCHRGNNVPAMKWFAAAPEPARVAAGNRAGQNAPAAVAGLASLPGDPLSAYLTGETPGVRVISTSALPTGAPGASIQETERTYAFMVHISESLGVNCTGCHNTRSFFAWDQGRPQRVVAWHGIRMARDVNDNYLVPLRDVFPAGRLGPTGDAAKVSCMTCHQGANKPLNGAPMLADYPELLPAKPAPPPEGAPVAPGAEEAAAPAATVSGGLRQGGPATAPAAS